MSLEVDDFMDAISTLLIAGVAELTADGVAVWHHGESDPDEDVKTAVTKCQGVSVLIYDLGGDTNESDVIECRAAVELYVDTTKRNRRKTPSLRKAGAIRKNIMTVLHRASTLRPAAQTLFDCRVLGYQPLSDPDYVCWRITVSHSIYLIQ